MKKKGQKEFYRWILLLTGAARIRVQKGNVEIIGREDGNDVGFMRWQFIGTEEQMLKHWKVSTAEDAAEKRALETN